MKKLLFLTLIIFATSCKKEAKINLKNITETDENCNIIGNVDSDDWGLHNLSNLSERDELIFNHEGGFIALFERDYNIKISDYNTTCPQDFNFNFRLCPNPFNINASAEGKINYQLTHDLDIYKMATLVVNRKNEIPTSSSGDGFPIPTGSFNPNYGTSFTYYYMVLTTDSCVFYGKGDVLIEN